MLRSRPKAWASDETPSPPRRARQWKVVDGACDVYVANASDNNTLPDCVAMRTPGKH